MLYILLVCFLIVHGLKEKSYTQYILVKVQALFLDVQYCFVCVMSTFVRKRILDFSLPCSVLFWALNMYCILAHTKKQQKVKSECSLKMWRTGTCVCLGQRQICVKKTFLLHVLYERCSFALGLVPCLSSVKRAVIFSTGSFWTLRVSIKLPGFTSQREFLCPLCAFVTDRWNDSAFKNCS